MENERPFTVYVLPVVTHIISGDWDRPDRLLVAWEHSSKVPVLLLIQRCRSKKHREASSMATKDSVVGTKVIQTNIWSFL